jgi:N-acetylmuramoyl-L-alanine amidase
MISLIESILWLTLTLYHEARSDPPIAREAVANVVINRSRLQKKTIKEIVLDHKQFSWVLEKSDHYPYETEMFLLCLKSCLKASLRDDFTNGATHYHKVGTVPYWSTSDDLDYVGIYGSHKFYKQRGSK